MSFIWLELGGELSGDRSCPWRAVMFTKPSKLPGLPLRLPDLEKLPKIKKLPSIKKPPNLKRLPNIKKLPNTRNPFAPQRKRRVPFDRSKKRR